MNKKDVKTIIMSMRTTENEKQINNLLGKIDLLEEEKLQVMINQIGNTEENIKKYLEDKLNDENKRHHEEHTPINNMFTYGIAGSCIHLHMPVDLHEMISEKGIKKSMNTVNLYLLDAIEKIRKLQNDGFYKFIGKDSIYMISPILNRLEMKFLEDLDFQTEFYKKKQLQDEKFIDDNRDAKLAVDIFGKDVNVGTAKISLNVINSQEWQSKREQKVKEFNSQGIVLYKNENEK